MKKIPLKDYFEGTCKQNLCTHNHFGYCTLDNDIGHYRDIIESVAENFGTDKGYFTCISFEREEYFD